MNTNLQTIIAEIKDMMDSAQDNKEGGRLFGALEVILERHRDFEKELRELISKSEKANLNSDFTVIYVKEILGE